MKDIKPVDKFISERRQRVFSNKKDLGKIVDRDSRQVFLDRKREQFFLDAYSRNYSREALENKSFLNIGPGSFSHRFWKTADKYYGENEDSWTSVRRGVEQPKPDYCWDMYDQQPLEIEDETIDVVYCSHVVEHGFDEDVRFLFRDVFRILKPGGVFRIVCPDADLFMDAYDREDWDFFLEYLSVSTDRLPVKDIEIDELINSGRIADFVVSFFGLLGESENGVVKKGKAARELLDDRLGKIGILQRISEMSDRELNKKLGYHVNWFNYNKVSYFLSMAGFKQIMKSGFLQSTCPVLRDPRYFDRTDPGMSLFAEVKKN